MEQQFLTSKNLTNQPSQEFEFNLYFYHFVYVYLLYLNMQLWK